jgi:hypothetical protein
MEFIVPNLATISLSSAVLSFDSFSGLTAQTVQSIFSVNVNANSQLTMKNAVFPQQGKRHLVCQITFTHIFPSVEFSLRSSYSSLEFLSSTFRGRFIECMQNAFKEFGH